MRLVVKLLQISYSALGRCCMIICYLTRGFNISCYYVLTEMQQVVNHYSANMWKNNSLFQQRVVIAKENVNSNEIEKNCLTAHLKRNVWGQPVASFLLAN